MIYREITINGQQIKLIPLGDCACGCGEKTQISKYDFKSRRWVKGQPRKYLLGHNARKNERSIFWKGGKSIDRDGYVHIKNDTHKRTNPSGYVLEHILIAEKTLGKELPDGAVIHHHNCIKNDNKTPGNLVICQDEVYHHFLHLRMKAYYVCGHANWRKCWYCKEYDDPINMCVGSKRNQAYHRECAHQYYKNRKERVCETRGRRNRPEDALSGPIGINVARLLGIKLPPIGEHPNAEPERRLVQNVAEQDTQVDD